MDPKHAPRISETSCGEDGGGRHRPRGRSTPHTVSSARSQREVLTARPLLRACLSGAISGFARAVFAWLFDDISL
jgi:hypothetical protein